MSKEKYFITISETSEVHFDIKVREFLNMGFELHGNPVIFQDNKSTDIHYFQSLVGYIEESTKENNE